MAISNRTMLHASRIPFMPLPSSACWACWWLVHAFMAPVIERLGAYESSFHHADMAGDLRSCNSGGQGKRIASDQAYLAFDALLV